MLATCLVDLNGHFRYTECCLSESKLISSCSQEYEVPNSDLNAGAATNRRKVGGGDADDDGPVDAPNGGVAKGKAGPAAPTPMQPATFTSSQIKFCKALMSDLMSKKHVAYAWPFYKPVDAVALEIPDYYEIIKKPMDLGTAKKKLDDGLYRSAAEFGADIRLIFTNCYRYNPPEYDVVKMARKTSEVFEARFSKLPLDAPPAPVPTKAPPPSKPAVPVAVPVPVPVAVPAPAPAPAPAKAPPPQPAPLAPQKQSAVLQKDCAELERETAMCQQWLSYFSDLAQRITALERELSSALGSVDVSTGLIRAPPPINVQTHTQPAASASASAAAAAPVSASRRTTRHSSGGVGPDSSPPAAPVPPAKSVKTPLASQPAAPAPVQNAAAVLAAARAHAADVQAQMAPSAPNVALQPQLPGSHAIDAAASQTGSKRAPKNAPAAKPRGKQQPVQAQPPGMLSERTCQIHRFFI